MILYLCSFILLKSTIEIGQGGAGGSSGIAGLNGGITSLYGQQLSIQANGGGGGGSNNAPGKRYSCLKHHMFLILYTSVLPCHLTQVCSAIVLSAT